LDRRRTASNDQLEAGIRGLGERRGPERIEGAERGDERRAKLVRSIRELGFTLRAI